MRILIVCFLIWVVFLSDLTITLEYKGVKRKVIWNGLLWVALDYYSIHKNKSDDKPMKIIQYTKTKNTIY